jgi:LysR family hydrogen peroxide-inducible transcriptional activator
VLLEQLLENELDVVIVALPVSAEGLQAWALYDEAFVALLPRDHRWSREPRIETRRLAEEKLLLLGPGHCFRDQVVEACPKCVEPQAGAPQPHTGSSLETIRYMVASGLGVTIVPRSSVENRPDDPKLLVARPLAKPAPQRRIALAWRRSYPRMQAISLLRDSILKSGMKGVKFLPQARPESPAHAAVPREPG